MNGDTEFYDSIRDIFEKNFESFFKFCIVGGASTILNYSVFFVLFKYIGVFYLLSSAIGYISGVIFGFYFNKIYTFEAGSDQYISQGGQYITVYTISLVAGLALLRGLVYLGVPVLTANVVVIGFTTVMNYSGSKYIVFSSVDVRQKVDYYLYRFRYLLKYILIGIGSLFLEIATIWASSFVSPFQWANVVFGFGVGMIFSYVLNARFNFKVPESRNTRTFQKFIRMVTREMWKALLVRRSIPANHPPDRFER